MEAEHQITSLLQALRAGESGALDRLLPLVYDELRRIAHRQFQRARDGHTLDTTALVHEAYLKMADQTRVESTDRAHFFGIAARAMHQILIDRARKHGTLKRGGRWARVPLDDDALTIEDRADMLLALDDALARLAAFDERSSRVVECRFFGGMTEPETATALGISERTVRRDWLKAKLWLYGELVVANKG
jgi:RNA polymerase sigma factor (TIGR02999 family)